MTFSLVLILHGAIALPLYSQLWHILELPTKAPITEANTTVGSATAAELVSFAHAALFSPALSTLIVNALARQRIHSKFSWGLSSQTLRNHRPHSIATLKGHLDHSPAKSKNQQTTKERDTDTHCSSPDQPEV
jgi:hypothetical protein